MQCLQFPPGHALDDLKLYEEDREGLERAIGTVEGVSELIDMSLGLKKCAVLHVRAGRVVEGGLVQLAGGKTIAELKTDETYKYLGIMQTLLPEAGRVRKTVEKEFLRRENTTGNSDLNASNCTTHGLLGH